MGRSHFSLSRIISWYFFLIQFNHLIYENLVSSLVCDKDKFKYVLVCTVILRLYAILFELEEVRRSEELLRTHHAQKAGNQFQPPASC